MFYPLAFSNATGYDLPRWIAMPMLSQNPPDSSSPTAGLNIPV